jgi:glycosyltransferase involved in cell wall biosynthesis
VPCFNEAANVARVVTELDEYAPFLDILVVDDGSSDATAVTA